ncbi:MAG: glycosyltransferase family 4 protein [Thaumarchaeota archaeon]|nr:glycosyltransferase family 4 protein [Nitrososphaerota archaeon]
MNICYVTPDVAIPHFRGASTHVYEVARSLSGRGHRVSVVSRRLKRSQPRWEVIDGFETYRTFQGLAFEPPMSSYSPSHVDRESATPLQTLYYWYLKSYRAFQMGAEVATVMSGRAIDVVMERETAFGAGAVLSSLLGVPLVLEIVGPRVSTMSLRRASKVLAYSRFMAGGRVPREKLEIVPAGVNTSLFAPDLKARGRVREEFGLGDSFVVGYVGTFQRWHGVNELLQACARLVASGRNVKVLLVGPYFAEAQRFARELGLGEDALFTGPVPYEAVPEYINACDVLCAPYDPGASKLRQSGGIGAPLKVLEYMACGKPVVATSVPPITEVVEEGKTGLLVPPGDPGHLSSALDQLIMDPSLRESMGKEGRKVVVQRYSWGSLAEAFERVLEAASHHRGANRGSGS